jgi:Domain of unknown function (DUF1835)
MTVHILNGDALTNVFEQAGLEGDVIICRECLVDGPVKAEGLYYFWKSRGQYIEKMFHQSEELYYRKVKAEFDKIDRLPPHAEVNLWFEHDLFCQVNMWFVISLLSRRNLHHVYRVAPLPAQKSCWKGFGNHTPVDLRVCYDNREGMTHGDFRLGEHLWDAYRHQNLEVLSLLSNSLSPCFPYLAEVCKAEVERKNNSRPQETLREILAMGYTEFSDIFVKFNERDGIYGYGDLQVGNLLKTLPGGSLQSSHGSMR